MTKELLKQVLEALETAKIGSFRAADGDLYKHQFFDESLVRLATDALRTELAKRETAPQPSHSDDQAVDRFAIAMKAKLAAARAKGRGGWDDPEQCTVGHLSELLRGHVGKGDPVDVANFAMMLHQRGSAVLPKATAPVHPAVAADLTVYKRVMEKRRTARKPMTTAQMEESSEYRDLHGIKPAAQLEQSLCGHCGRQVAGDAWPIKPAAQPSTEARCKYCDGTGDVTTITGEWRGTCNSCIAALCTKDAP